LKRRSLGGELLDRYSALAPFSIIPRRHSAVGGLLMALPGVIRESLEVLHDGVEVELVACTGESAQSQALEAMMGFQVRKSHLDPLIYGYLIDERSQMRALIGQNSK
jgi:hypothetical protein